MRKVLFCFILFLMVTIPVGVEAEIYYWPYTEYMVSTREIAEEHGMEVYKDDTGIVPMYYYRYRHYLLFPDEIIIESEDFEFWRTITSNLPIDNFIIKDNYDLTDHTKRKETVEILYLDQIIYKTVIINIVDEYIRVPDEIVITVGDNFDLLSYFDMNIQNINELKIIGEYNIYKEGKYPLLITYHGIEKEVMIVVEADHKQEAVDNTDSNTNNNVNNNINNTLNYYYEWKPYIVYENHENFYPTPVVSSDTNNTQEVTTCVETKNVVEVKKDKEFYLFSYISYAFYGIVVLFLSIIVVRKK